MKEKKAWYCRWRGPVSVAVYAPGADYADAVRAAIMLRRCDAKPPEFYYEDKEVPSRYT